MKLRWVFSNATLFSRFGVMPYRISKYNSKYTPYVGLDSLGEYDTQLEAIKICQNYENKLNA